MLNREPAAASSASCASPISPEESLNPWRAATVAPAGMGPEAVMLGSFRTTSALVRTSAARASGTATYIATPAPSSVSLVSATW